jgi:hypothetical protein
MTYPVTNNLEVTSIARFSSGTPYTPRVAGDVNGDGVNNDRAFIYTSSAADPQVAAGMSRLLANSGGRVRSCLEQQAARIAERNSCRGPWQPSLDLQLNYRPTALGLNQRLLLSLTTVNFLAGLDELFHGGGNLRGWGQGARPDGTLLSVQGFDPATQRYQYLVNERFGATAASANAIRTPFQIGIQARYTIGPDRRQEFLRRMRGGGGSGGGRQPGGPGGPGGDRGGFEGGAAGILSRIDSLLPNPAKEIIDIRIALRLTDDQVARLTAVSDSMTLSVKAVGDTARVMNERAGQSPDPLRLMMSLQPLLQRLRAAQRVALTASEGILTPEQWAQVPERIKTPPGGFGPRQQGRRPPDA